jgi:hypothetical protein
MMREMADGYLPSIYYYLSVFNYFCLTGAQTFAALFIGEQLKSEGISSSSGVMLNDFS